MHDLMDLLGPVGTTSEAVLCRAASPRSVRRWLASGRLVRLHPGWVTVPELADDWTVRAHAATGYTGGTLSHASALTAHDVIEREGFRLDVTVSALDRLRSTPRLRIHRTRRPCGISMPRGLAATTIARALVDTWGDAHRDARSRRYVDLARNAVLRATRERRVTVPALESELATVPRLPGLATLRELLADARAGSQSHLEILGLRALEAAGVPPPQLQYAIPLSRGVLHVDAAWPEVKLAVEFDGAAFHADRLAWQRDLRRDAALAALGWVVLRFTWADVTERPVSCGAQVAATYARRRLAGPQAAVPAPGMAGPGTPWDR